ncbi:pre-mRNA-splicing factor CWC22 homolog [Xenia sp. Carnegie-2017]|uniref:pre-mRNA-splicing factor CWC22 homolog n=1 Tax=Xenia sp. Carnegie-2017 TaxID=2897299 RepID=UPI001F0378AE|nr:pre-mRNA-splicing factor CWC22 homolog [Xenia sp. Carnegie-2017]
MPTSDIEEQRRSRDFRESHGSSSSSRRPKRKHYEGQEKRKSPGRNYERELVVNLSLFNTRSKERRSRDEKRSKMDDEKRSRMDDENVKENVLDKENRKHNLVKGSDEQEKKDVTTKKKEKTDSIFTRAGGAYIPPAKLKMLQEQIEDKSSAEYQRISWEALKKSINGLINKVNTSNLGNIVRELFQENIVRGRGLLAQSIIKAQSSSPTFTHVYAALVSVINTKAICLSATRFIAHLVNQQVAHEILALEILTLLLQSPTDDSVELSIAFLKECGMKLTDVSPRGINVKDHPAVIEELDVVDESDQITHLLRLEEAGKTEDILNIFKFDPDYLANEEKYKQIKKELLGEGDDDDDDESDNGDSESGDEDSDDVEEESEKIDILDQTETNLVSLRRTVYLTIQSSLDFQECAHKMMKMNIQPSQMGEVCNMIIDCCAQQRSYEKFFGLLGQRFCQLKKEYVDEFVRLFKDQYDTIHRLETNKLRNVAKFFSHLLYTDAIPWTVLADINLNEEDTTSSSRIFIKILFQELAEYMGLPKLNERLKDPTLEMYFEGLFPRDNPRNTRFAVNFFTAIGLGGLTDGLREHLKKVPKKTQLVDKSSDSSDSSDNSESSSDDSSTDSTNTDESSSSDDRRRTKKRRK